MTQRPADNRILEDCIRRCAEGDAGGLQRLYELTRAGVYGYALSLLGDAFDAEEVMQDTFVAIFRASGGYEPRGKPMAWILTAARNLAISRVRERNRTCALDGDAAGAIEAGPRMTEEDRLAIRSLLTALSAEEREIVTLHAVSGLKHREIAELTGLSLGTVLSKYNRAIKKLQRAWEEAER